MKNTELTPVVILAITFTTLLTLFLCYGLPIYLFYHFGGINSVFVFVGYLLMLKLLEAITKAVENRQ